MRFLRNSAGIAVTECTFMLAIAAFAFLLSVEAISVHVVEFASANF